MKVTASVNSLLQNERIKSQKDGHHKDINTNSNNFMGPFIVFSMRMSARMNLINVSHDSVAAVAYIRFSLFLFKTFSCTINI